MEERFQSLAAKIFKKDFSEVTKDEAASLASQYPYFAPLQFLKLNQSAPGSDEHQQQYQKSILYYPDPLTFDHFLYNGQEFEFEGEAERVHFGTDESFEEAATDVEVIEEDRDVIIPEEIPANTEDRSLEVLHPEPREESLEQEEEVPVDLTLQPLETSEELGEAAPDKGTVNDNEPSIPSLTIAPTDLTGPELTFEPYHTVDYFASQGIKVTADTVSQDKFGKQVKSFTDWLKTMKRLPLAELGKNVTPVTERKVENLAEHSVQDADVVTESMAQVWEKQGNIAKATEVYHKLSLQNPSKRAYFAAKIDKLTEEN